MKIKRRHLLELAGAGVLTLTAAGLFLGGGSPVGPVSEAAAQSADELMEPGALPDKVLGEADAPVTIIEYSSMTCPHCAAFHTGTLPGIKEKYIDTGKAKLVFREFPFDPRAMAAFMLARCAPDDRYFPLIDVLYKQQRTWATAEDARQPLLQISKLAGFTQESFEACLKNQEMLDNIGKVQKRAAEEFGVQSTPTFFINGEKVSGNMSVEDMSKLIDKHL